CVRQGESGQGRRQDQGQSGPQGSTGARRRKGRRDHGTGGNRPRATAGWPGRTAAGGVAGSTGLTERPAARVPVRWAGRATYSSSGRRIGTVDPSQSGEFVARLIPLSGDHQYSCTVSSDVSSAATAAA